MTINTQDLAFKFNAIEHNAKALTALLHRIADFHPPHDDAALSDALDLAGLIQGIADAGLQALPEVTP
jgi:hypothetical protein